MNHALASFALFGALVASMLLQSCTEPLPIKASVCKDNVCVGVETVIPARQSAKDVKAVQYNARAHTFKDADGRTYKDVELVTYKGHDYLLSTKPDNKLSGYSKGKLN